MKSGTGSVSIVMKSGVVQLPIEIVSIENR